MNKPKLDPLDKIFNALSDGTRRGLMRRLAGQSLSIKDLSRGSDLGFAAISKHVGVLEEAQLVTKVRQGSFHLISLNHARLNHAQHWLAFFETYWDERLNALDAFLKETSSNDSDADTPDG